MIVSGAESRCVQGRKGEEEEMKGGEIYYLTTFLRKPQFAPQSTP